MFKNSVLKKRGLFFSFDAPLLLLPNKPCDKVFNFKLKTTDINIIYHKVLLYKKKT